LPAGWLKLASNMVLLAAETLPRGGAITVAGGNSPAPRLEVSASGEVINVTKEGRAALTLEVGVDELTSRTVHGYFTARLAEALGAAFSLAEPATDRISLIAAAP